MVEERTLCKHLRAVEQHLRAAGHRVTSAGTPWSKNCRYWVTFDAVLDVDDLRRRFALPAAVEVHENRDPRSGAERGLVCALDNDAVMGLLPG